MSMDPGGCRLSGGGGSDNHYGSDGSRGGMITLEDLESFSEDQLSDSGSGSLEEDGQAMEEDESNRMFHYWQDAARGHQVEVPRDMAEPIYQLTTNNEGAHERESVPFTLISRKEKCGEVLYEKRHYEKAYWACTTVNEETYEQSICYGFMKLMRYICQQNSTGSYLGLTIPILTVVRMDALHQTMSRAVTVAYHLPTYLQAQPPCPNDTDIVVEEWAATVVYTRAFTGPTNEETILHQMNTMVEILGSPQMPLNDSFIVAGYTNPAATNRQNEIWFIERP
ncbi:hypothetical protein COCON_G00014510 [Conger conger]|uniref:Heme-binding protein 1 n=1 Tax=Conger conger TaxID=82655 RepID=A0A9Q1I7K6_CONCO|nr:heme-binding protein soul3 [Conger conger]KAJ8288792.1 hypothetical protein COCON_G00014510 [Conger conger]